MKLILSLQRYYTNLEAPKYHNCQQYLYKIQAKWLICNSYISFERQVGVFQILAYRQVNFLLEIKTQVVGFAELDSSSLF